MLCSSYDSSTWLCCVSNKNFLLLIRVVIYYVMYFIYYTDTCLQILNNELAIWMLNIKCNKIPNQIDNSFIRFVISV